MTEAVADIAPKISDRAPSSCVALCKERKKRAMKLVNIYTAGGTGALLIPGALMTQVVVGGVVTKMLYDLAEIYDVKLTDHKAKVIIASLLGSTHSIWISRYIGGYLEFIPGINVVGKGIVSAGLLYMIGCLFIKHFESGSLRT